MIARQMLLRFRADTRAVDASSSPEMPTKALPEALPEPLPEALPKKSPTPAAAARDVPEPHLSPREHEVLNLITRGYTTDEIANLLQLTRHTVLTFVRRAYTKLNVNSKAEAIYELQNRR
jgi:DNA-binding CsgD family transcriptional regulator